MIEIKINTKCGRKKKRIFYHHVYKDEEKWRNKDENSDNLIRYTLLLWENIPQPFLQNENEWGSKKTDKNDCGKS